MQSHESENAYSWSGLLSILIIAGIPLLYCYFMFFAFHDSILNFHRPSDLMISWVIDPHNTFGANNEHDGVEPYVLFMMLVSAGPLGYLLYRSSFSKNVLTIVGMILWFVFIIELHFFQRLFTITEGVFSAWGITIVLFFGGALSLQWLYNKSSLLGQLIIAELVFVVCFIPLCDISYYDYSFLLAPALRLIQSGKISGTFFQYDLLPSLPALFILKGGHSVYLYRYVVQGCMFAFVIGMFLTGRKFYTHKNLSFWLLVLLVMIRFYMGLGEVTYCPQVTAIRLDWWLLLFAISYFWGLEDKRLGIALFLLLLLLNTWGVIYFICYLLLLTFLFALNTYSSYRDDPSLSIIESSKYCIKKYAFNVSMGLAGVLIYRLLTGNFMSESVTLYGGYQLGMQPIQQESSFWYFAAVYTFCFILLLGFRKQFTTRYFNSSLFLLALCAGCSMYFFGRSHENNVINISGPLIFVTVLCCDLLLTLSISWTEPFKGLNRILSMTPVLLIFVVFAVNNSKAFVSNGGALLNTLKTGPWTYPEVQPPSGSLQTIKGLTKGNHKVYFMTFWGNDFYLYYRGNYNVPSKYNPIDSWYIFNDEIAFANKKLAEGYDVVGLSTDECFRKDFLPKLRYVNYADVGGYIVISN